MRPLVLLAGLAAGCGGGPTAPDVDRAPFEFEFADPAGDTLATPPAAPPAGARAPDLVRVSGRVERGTIRFVLEFAEPVAPWSARAPNSLDGFLDIDLDENALTGIAGAGAGAGGDPDLGAEFYVDLRDPQGGRMALIEPARRRFVLIPARFEGSRVTIEIPRGELGPDDGQFHFALVVGLPGRPVTDVAPNTGHFAARHPDAP
jgi:hypothetical protein